MPQRRHTLPRKILRERRAIVDFQSGFYQAGGQNYALADIFEAANITSYGAQIVAGQGFVGAGDAAVFDAKGPLLAAMGDGFTAVVDVYLSSLPTSTAGCYVRNGNASFAYDPGGSIGLLQNDDWHAESYIGGTHIIASGDADGYMYATSPHRAQVGMNRLAGTIHHNRGTLVTLNGAKPSESLSPKVAHSDNPSTGRFYCRDAAVTVRRVEIFSPIFDERVLRAMSRI